MTKLLTRNLSGSVRPPSADALHRVAAQSTAHVRAAAAVGDTVMTGVHVTLKDLSGLWRVAAIGGMILLLLVANVSVRMWAHGSLHNIQTFERNAAVAETELSQLALELEMRTGTQHLQQAATAAGLVPPVRIEAVSTTVGLDAVAVGNVTP